MRYLLGDDFWVENDGGNDSRFLLLEEGVYDQNSADLDAEKILLQRLGFLRMKKDSSIGANVYGSWQASCNQRFIRGFFVRQDKSTQPRAASAFWSAPASNRRGVS